MWHTQNRKRSLLARVMREVPVRSHETRTHCLSSYFILCYSLSAACCPRSVCIIPLSGFFGLDFFSKLNFRDRARHDRFTFFIHALEACGVVPDDVDAL